LSSDKHTFPKGGCGKRRSPPMFNGSIEKCSESKGKPLWFGVFDILCVNIF